jgi:alpha-amylase
VIAFSRGSAGWIAINNESAAVTRTFTTGLAAGTYCDVISGTVSSGSCTGTAVTVNSSGTASVTVPAGGAVAIDVNATGTGSTATTAAVTFNVTATTAWGTNVYVVGSVAALGSWSTGSAVALSSASYPVWSGTVSLPANTAFEYKYIKKDSSGNVTWESGSNRSYTTGTAAVSLSDTWK